MSVPWEMENVLLELTHYFPKLSFTDLWDHVLNRPMA